MIGGAGIRRLVLALAALAAAVSAARAEEDVPQTISPLRVESDHQGVNLVNGRTVIEPPALSVPAAPNLRFDRIQNAAPYVKGNVQTPPGAEIDQRRYTIHTGTGASDSFHCANYVCANGTVTRFLYDPGSGSGAGGDALVAEYNAAGEMTRRYVHWEGQPAPAEADVPIVSYATDSLASPSYLHADHQGSIVAISDASGVTQINRYDEYGIPAATNAGRFQYTGQVWLAELGLYYYKARLYSPTLGRFWQTDPVGYEGGFSLYAYVGDDPINRVDPTGLFRNCPPNDPTCIETPESEQQPGDPPPPSPDETETQDIIVTGTRPQTIDYTDDREEFFTISGGQMTPRPMTWHNVTCPNGDSIRTGTMSGIPSDSNAAHSHGDGLEQHPGPRDDNAALHSQGGVAGLMTRNRSFTIRAFPNGTFRTRQVEGPPLTADERSKLIQNMRNWENHPDPGPSQSLAQRVCH